jgi:nitric oxide reductase NorQ protein
LVSAGRLICSGMSLRLACQAAIVDALTDDIATSEALGEVVSATVGDA